MRDNKDMRVFLSGYLDVPPDRLGAVRAALQQHIARTRAEPGCIAFEVVEDDDRDGRFHVSEIFDNQAAFDAHQARTQSSAWFEATQGIARHYEITTGAPDAS